MQQATVEYGQGDWIVHSRYGIGQIIDIDVKDISGEKNHYFRIKSANSLFWIPVDQMDNKVIRPLSSPQEIEEAIVILQKSPKKMNSSYKIRQSRIREIRIQNKPSGIAGIMRDLKARQRDKVILNQSERSALNTFIDAFAREWALVKNIQFETAQTQLEGLLSRRPAVVN
jgi:RNA polymerase-interacting CarD/CdnL/TRCF family regulator